MTHECLCLVGGKERGRSCMWSEVVWTGRWRSERTRPDPVGTSCGWLNNRQLGERIVSWEEKRVPGVIWEKEKKGKKKTPEEGNKTWNYSWYSEKNLWKQPRVNPAPGFWRWTVKRESACRGQQPTFDLAVWETMTAAANMNALHRGGVGQSERATAEQRLNVNSPGLCRASKSFLFVNLELVYQHHERPARMRSCDMSVSPILVKGDGCVSCNW